MDSAIAASPLWDFALAIYTKPGVEPLCLGLQDNHGVNVNVLLFARWLETCQLRLDLPAALECIDAWDRNYVQALRKLRRQMKQDFADELDVVRNQIKRAELLAERQELYWLEQLARKWPHDTSIAAGDNLRAYLAQLQVPEPAIAEAIVALA